MYAPHKYNLMSTEGSGYARLGNLLVWTPHIGKHQPLAIVNNRWQIDKIHLQEES